MSDAGQPSNAAAAAADPRQSRAPWFSVTLGLLFTAVFIWGIVSIVRHQLVRGGSYPNYSTPSLTPTGLRALSDTLRSLPGLDVRQDNRNFSVLKGNPENLFILAGFDTYTYILSHLHQPLSLLELTKVEEFPEKGATLLIAFANLADDPRSSDNLEQSRKFAMQQHIESEDELPEQSCNRAARTARLGERMLKAGALLDMMLGLNFEVRPGSEAERRRLTDPARPPRREIATLADSAPVQLDKELTWKSLNFLKLSPGWIVLYNTPEGRPAIAMRKVGKGRIIVSASSDWLCNSGLRLHAAPRLLAWIVDGHERIFFLERHLSFQDTRGVMWLVREHGLLGFVVGLLLLLVLFLWRNSTSLAPRLDLAGSEERGAVLLGQDSSEGFLNLLSRNVPRKEILPKAYASWVKWRASRSPAAANRAGAMETELRKSQTGELSEEELVRTYRNMAAILNRHPDTSTGAAAQEQKGRGKVPTTTSST
ncbi:MAG: hypothetical protein ACAI35_02085 [Candidatus Methylacidiphilales bacterium]|nr:hypothetical protein [Candidatus Methylacidiphilales bacterium]